MENKLFKNFIENLKYIKILYSNLLEIEFCNCLINNQNNENFNQALEVIYDKYLKYYKKLKTGDLISQNKEIYDNITIEKILKDYYSSYEKGEKEITLAKLYKKSLKILKKYKMLNYDYYETDIIIKIKKLKYKFLDYNFFSFSDYCCKNKGIFDYTNCSDISCS